MVAPFALDRLRSATKAIISVGYRGTCESLARSAKVYLGEQMANINNLAEELHDRFEVPLGFRDVKSRDRFSCGVPEIDAVLEGGFPRATLSEITGSQSSNRTALTVAILARAFDAGECGAWIDGNGSFDPESAAEAGLELSRLLWVNCRGNPEHALKATDLLLQAGGFGLIVFDVGEQPENVLGRLSMASWFRLRLAAEQTGTALITLTPAPQTRSCSVVCIELTRTKSIWRGRLFRGIASLLETRKHINWRKVSLESVL
jgi:hypothetical protein